MSEAAQGMIGTVLLLGSNVRSALARALEFDDLATVRGLIQEADHHMDALLRCAQDAQAKAEEQADAPEALKAATTGPQK